MEYPSFGKVTRLDKAEGSHNDDAADDLIPPQDDPGRHHDGDDWGGDHSIVDLDRRDLESDEGQDKSEPETHLSGYALEGKSCSDYRETPGSKQRTV